MHPLSFENWRGKSTEAPWSFLSCHDTAANDLLQFHYIEIASNTSGDKYVLMIGDDHFDYEWLFAFPGHGQKCGQGDYLLGCRFWGPKWSHVRWPDPFQK